MRSVTFIVTITLFGVVTAGWNRFHGHSGRHFGSDDESFHFGHHESQHGPYHFGPHRESSHFGSPYKHPPPHESPYYSHHHEPSFFKPTHKSSNFRPPHFSTPHFDHPHHPSHHGWPPWKRPDWDRPGPINDYNDDSDSSSSEEYYDDDPGNTQITAQWTTLAAGQTTTESMSTSFTMHKGTLSNPSTTSIASRANSTVEDCVTSCKTTMTPEYNPVCGTNNVTYQNIGLFLCTKSCGVDVELKRKFACPKNNGVIHGHLMQTTQLTVGGHTADTNQLTTSGRTSQMTQAILNCVHTCPFNTEFSPVCGTDLVTYFNHDRFLCAKNCGVDVELKCRFPCATSNCHAVETTTTTATTTASATNLANTALSRPSLQHCLLRCTVTNEYNPVCGTNNITYGNPSKLLCAQLCGVDVRAKHISMCPTDSDGGAPSTPAVAKAASTTLRPYTVACMRGCTVTPEYNPVCGTNHVTYTNPGKLECAKLCGVDVEILFNSACEITDQNDFTHPTEPTSGHEVTQPQSSSSGFTIDQSLLESIFGKTATTTQTGPTTEEVFDIDPRYNNL